MLGTQVADVHADAPIGGTISAAAAEPARVLRITDTSGD